MTNYNRDLSLKHLYDAFALFERPDPLTTYEGSHCNEEVDVFNRLDWEEATYSDFVDGMEGAIICPALTRAYLLPRLFKMVMIRRSGKTDDAVDNVSVELKVWPIEASVEILLNNDQRKAIIAAWTYLDRHIYHPSGSHVARELVKRWEREQKR